MTVQGSRTPQERDRLAAIYVQFLDDVVIPRVKRGEPAPTAQEGGLMVADYLLSHGVTVEGGALRAVLSAPAQELVAKARRFAEEQHSGQSDKQGEPYIRHVGRVAASVLPDEKAEVVAWLHDTVEDCRASLDYLALVFGGEIADAVKAITRRDGEPYGDYVQRVAANPLARVVKVADLVDNLRRAPEIAEPDRSRLTNRYRAALFVLAPERSCSAPIGERGEQAGGHESATTATVRGDRESADRESARPAFPLGEPSERAKALEAIVAWQRASWVHPLTCGNDSRHAPLFPAIEPDSGRVVLLCRDCDWAQEHVPDVVLHGPPPNPWDAIRSLPGAAPTPTPRAELERAGSNRVKSYTRSAPSCQEPRTPRRRSEAKEK